MAAYTGTPALPALLAGDIPSATTDWAAIIGALHGLTDPWTIFTPQWISGGTAPVLGNGTLTGKYMRSGKLIDVFISLTMGSTTTYGTGNYSFILPVNAIAGTSAVGSARLLDAGIIDRAGACYVDGVNYVSMNSSTGQVSQTSPHTWGNADQILVQIRYEAV